MSIVLPGPRDIQIDLDSVEALESFCLRLAILKRNGIIFSPSWSLTTSKTPNHFHVTIVGDRPRPQQQRVLLAALLGSDGVREVLNFIRVARGRRIPVAFFEEPS